MYQLLLKRELEMEEHSCIEQGTNSHFENKWSEIHEQL